MGDVMLGRDFYETRGSWSVRSAKSSGSFNVSCA
jgi:hypothetical protein